MGVPSRHECHQFPDAAGAAARAAKPAYLCAHCRCSGGCRIDVLAEHFRWAAVAAMGRTRGFHIGRGYRPSRWVSRAHPAPPWGDQYSHGRMLDPIADKLLVASCLLMLAAEEPIRGWSLLAAVVSLCRDILVYWKRT